MNLIERQKEAALQRLREENDDRRRIADLVVGNSRHRRVTDIIRLGDGDYIVQTDDNMWMAVVGNSVTGAWEYHSQDEALLDLVARRAGARAGEATNAVFFACRVLGVTEQ